MSKHHNRFRLRGKRYEAFRREQLDRHGWRCAKCGAARMLELDHRVPLEDGGEPWAESNVQPLCKSCHREKTVAEYRKRHPVPEAVQAWRDLVEKLV